MMKAWQPVPTLTKTIIMFFILSGIFLGIGIPMIILSQNLNENSLRYDNLGTANCTGTVCNVTFEVTSYLQAPVFVYYEIHNFYQNHRLYASSYSYDQLIGDQISSSTVKNLTHDHRHNPIAPQSSTTATYTRKYQPSTHPRL
jgi:hypothetical protein